MADNNYIEAEQFANMAIENDKLNNIESAIFFYTEAVESILIALRNGSSNLKWQELAKNYVSRAEELKKKQNSTKSNESLMSENTKERSRAMYMLNEALKEDEEGNKNHAMKLYEESISLLLNLANSSSIDKEKENLRNFAKNALERAETLKLSINNDLNEPIVNKSVSHSSSGFTPFELEVLKATSVINERKYLPFIDHIDYKERFSYTVPFSDKDGLLALSQKQKNALQKWLRPSEYLEDPRMIMAVSCFSICQTVVTDCSFVASIAVAAQYERRFKQPLITNIMYPQDRQKRCVYNPCGKYMVKLHINGVQRKVIIDDFLPMGRHGKLLCSFSSNRSELWISLLEKAYMKVMGGYDFPGSNSNIDLHALTGWIPERIPLLKNDPIKFKADKEFKKLYDHFHKGNCLATLATGDLSSAEEDRAGLVATHAYAMLDIREVGNQRLLMLKNPWSHVRWKGRFSEQDTASWTPVLQKALNYDMTTARNVDNGVFWIDYDSLQHFFDVLYVSWSPAIFPYTTCLHDRWTLGQGVPRKDFFSIGQNPQFRLKLQPPAGSATQSLWILMTRHIMDKDDFANNREFIALLVYGALPASSSRLFYPHEPSPLVDGVRINSPHYLVKRVLEPGTDGSEFVLVISQYDKNASIAFTLRAYATCPVQLTKLIDPYRYRKTIQGSWTESNAGGCPNFPETFQKNPIFQIKLNNSNVDNRILIELKAPKDFAVGFELVCVDEYNTANPQSFKKKSSGDYRRGYLVIELTNMSGGIYNIRVTTFQPQQKGPFILTIGSIRDLTVNQLT